MNRNSFLKASLIVGLGALSSICKRKLDLLSKYLTFFPTVIQDHPRPFPLGVQIEHHQASSVKQWIPDPSAYPRQIQTSIKWRDVETIMGVYGWSAYDPDFAALSGHSITVGIKVVPEWARLWTEYVASPPKPSRYVKLAYFIKAVINRYDPDAIELFNEPDVDRDGAKWAEEFFGAWCVNNDWYNGGKLYGQMTAVVYPIVKAAYSDVRIIAGALIGSDPSSLTFLQGMIDGGLMADALSFHKYLGLGESFNNTFEFSLSVANKTSLPQVLSETSITADQDSDELKQAQVDYLNFLLQHYGWSNIKTIQWYTLANNGWMNTDLVRYGVPTPAYQVWAA